MSRPNTEIMRVELNHDGGIQIAVSPATFSRIKASLTEAFKDALRTEVVQFAQHSAPELTKQSTPPPELPSATRPSRDLKRDYLSVNEVAEQYGVCPRTVWRWLSGYDLPHYRIGRMVRLKTEEVQEWVEKQQRRRR